MPHQRKNYLLAISFTLQFHEEHELFVTIYVNAQTVLNFVSTQKNPTIQLQHVGDASVADTRCRTDGEKLMSDPRHTRNIIIQHSRIQAKRASQPKSVQHLSSAQLPVYTVVWRKNYVVNVPVTLVAIYMVMRELSRQRPLWNCI